MSTTATAATAAAEPWLTTKALSNVLVMAGGFCTVVAAVLLFGFGGWEYYQAPLGLRGYLPQHKLLRPSGPVGLTLGISGAIAMLCTLPYAVRKRWKRLSTIGTLRGWLETHIFFGVVAPVLVTFHTSFKFNGLVSVAYWLMMLVWISGFVGRYLYVRIPKTIRGAELSRADIEQRLAVLRTRLNLGSLPPSAARELASFEAVVTPAAGRAPGLLDLFFGELRVRVRLRLLRRHLAATGADLEAVDQAVTLGSERASLERRLAHLERTKHLFELWHVFHRPLVYGLLVIVALHIGIAVYFGYARLRA